MEIQKYQGKYLEGMSEAEKMVVNVNSIGQYLQSEIKGEYGKMSPRLREAFVGTLTKARKSLSSRPIHLENLRLVGSNQATATNVKGGHNIVEVMRKINGLLSLLEEI